jgi:hypothetical protein
MTNLNEQTEKSPSADVSGSRQEPVVMCDYKAVIVKWVDSFGCGSAWEEIEAIKVSQQYCYSIGLAVKQTDDVIVIVPHISPENEKNGALRSGCGDMTIPMVAVVSINQLYT